MNNKSDFIIVNGVLKRYNGFSQDVIIPDGVTEIGFKAFMDCENLTNVTIPKSVKRIGRGAFGECPKLKSIVISESVEFGDAFPDETKTTFKKS